MGKTQHSYVIRMQVKDGKVVTSELQRVGDSGERSLNKIDKAGKRVDGRLSLLSRTVLTRLLPAFGAFQLGRSLSNNIQAFEKLDNRIKFLTDSSEAYTRSQKFLSDTSKELHTDILALGDGYARLLALQKGGILDLDEVEQLLVGLSNAKAALGADETQLGQAIYGLSQALTQGQVQAQEFNQVIEPMPGLMQAMDKAAGVAAGGLRRMMKDGEVSSTFLKEILIEALKEFEGAAANMGDTSTGAITDLKNAWFELGVELEKAGFGEKMNEIVGILADITKGAGEAINALRLLFDPTKLEQLEKITKRIEQIKANPRGRIFGIELFGDVNEALTTAELKQLEERRQSLLGEINGDERAAANKPFGPFPRSVPKPAKKPQEVFDRHFKEMEKNAQAARKEADSINAVVDALRFRNEQLERSSDDQELYNQLQQAGVDLNSKQGKEIQQLVARFQELSKAQEEATKQTERLNRAADGIGQAFGSAFERASLEGKGFGDVIRALGEDIQRSLFRNFISDPLSESISGFAKDIFSSFDFFGAPTRDSGGYAMAGRPHKVGVPEIFIPSNSGRAIPLDMLPSNGSGFGQVTINNFGPPDQVRARQSKVGGQQSLEITVQQVVAQGINSGGNPINSALKQFGSTPTTGR